jgi:hypothetical protein
MKLVSQHQIGSYTNIALVEAHGTQWCVESDRGYVRFIRENSTDKALRRNSAKFSTLAAFTLEAVKKAQQAPAIKLDIENPGFIHTALLANLAAIAKNCQTLDAVEHALGLLELNKDYWLITRGGAHVALNWKSEFNTYRVAMFSVAQ